MQILTQDTDFQLCIRVFLKRGEGWRIILGTEAIPRGHQCSKSS